MYLTSGNKIDKIDRHAEGISLKSDYDKKARSSNC